MIWSFISLEVLKTGYFFSSKTIEASVVVGVVVVDDDVGVVEAVVR